MKENDEKVSVRIITLSTKSKTLKMVSFERMKIKGVHHHKVE